MTVPWECMAVVLYQKVLAEMIRQKTIDGMEHQLLR